MNDRKRIPASPSFTPSCAILTFCLAGSFFVGARPLAAQTGEIPLIKIEEPTPDASSTNISYRVLRPLNWSTARGLLESGKLPAPDRAETFSLTPREPYRVPGGLIQLRGSDRQLHRAWWQPGEPDPTGSVGIDARSEVWVHLQDVRPSYMYNVDLTVDSQGYGATLNIWSCRPGTRYDYNYGSTFLTGAHHVFVSMVTDDEGGACIRLYSEDDTWILLYRVDVSELGPYEKAALLR